MDLKYPNTADAERVRAPQERNSFFIFMHSPLSFGFWGILGGWAAGAALQQVPEEAPPEEAPQPSYASAFASHSDHFFVENSQALCAF